MRCLARQGRRASALRQYAACVQVLRAELGVEPSLHTQVLRDQIAAGAPLPGASPPPNNLPGPVDALVGRG